MKTSSPERYSHWRLEPDTDGIVWLCLDKADGSANVLSQPVFAEFADILSTLENDPPRGLVIYSGKRNGFVMGADINEFKQIETPENAYDLIRLGQQILDRVAALRCPTVAAIDGFALGGGLELAMACDYRVALHKPQPTLGLPEVQLGLHPGFGGTVRAVQIIGVRAAMPLLLTGKPVTAEKAMRQGLVDRIASPDNWKQAARELIAARAPKKRAPFTDRVLNLAPFRPFVARMLQKEVAAKARPAHYPAPYAIIDLWRAWGASGRRAYEAEARSFGKLMVGSTSRNLVRVFFLQNRLKSLGNKPATKISRVHVVGAGVMGGDIAAWCALKGLEVTLQDRAMEYIQPALDRASKLYDKKLRSAEDRAATRARLQADPDGAGAAEADLVIEAIFEDLEAKHTLFRSLQSKMQPAALLATNTSSIRLEDLRTVLDDPERFIGLHFFNPVAQLPLVEVIRCDDTRQEALDLGFAFVKGIGKLPLECRSSPGFVVNRLLAPYMAEAMQLAQDGVAFAEIDRAAEQFGMPMGPIELIDSVGIDVALHVSHVLGSAFNRPVPSQLKDMVDQQQLGRKSGQGFYRWVDGKAVKSPGAAGGQHAIADETEDRLMLPMVNEAVACLHEGVVSDADLLDAGVIFGTGFAPFRGGPLQYARERGIAATTAVLEQLADQYGEHFRPHPGWSMLR